MGLKSTLGILMLAAFFYMTFTMGSVMGGSAALNESVEYDDVHQNVSSLDEEIKQNMTEDNGAGGEFAAAYAEPMLKGVIRTTLWGIDFGYERPKLAKAHAEAAPFILISGIGVVVYRFYRRVSD